MWKQEAEQALAQKMDEDINKDMTSHIEKMTF